LQVADDASEEGTPEVYAAVFDGHGGAGTADWLVANLLKYVEKYWEGARAPEKAITEAFIQADKVTAAGLVQQQSEQADAAGVAISHSGWHRAKRCLKVQQVQPCDTS
jgi:serine/threonine protein phosphatase PrpC